MKPAAIVNLNYRVTTAEILYRMPDHPHLLQSFVWQQMDLAPDFPALRRFLDYWRGAIEAELHSVTVAHAAILPRDRFRHAAVSLQIH